MDSSFYNIILKQSFIKIIQDDYNKFIKSIYDKYGKDCRFTIEDVFKKYALKKCIIKGKTIPNKKKHIIAPYNTRCRARTWGGQASVRYNKSNHKWHYGYQCKRNSNKISSYCTIHHKQIKSGNGLTHGSIGKEPPHNHYLKYKRIYSILHGIVE